MVMPPSLRSVRGPIFNPRTVTHSGVIMLTFAPVSKSTNMQPPSIVAYPALSLPSQHDIASSFSTGVGLPSLMHLAMHLTLWEECFLQPSQAAFGTSVLPCSVPPSCLNPFYPLGPAGALGSCRKSAQSHHRYSTFVPAVHNDMQYRLP